MTKPLLFTGTVKGEVQATKDRRSRLACEMLSLRFLLRMELGRKVITVTNPWQSCISAKAL